MNGVPISATSNWTQADNNVYYTTGNVGIGTTALPPLAKLDVRGDIFVGLTAVPDNTITSGNNIYVADDGGGDPRNSFRMDSYINNLYLVARSGTNSTAGTGIGFRTARAGGGEIDRMRIDENGHVGIGTTTPTNGTLDVESVSGGTAVYGQASGIGVMGNSDHGIAVYGFSGAGGTGVYGLSVGAAPVGSMVTSR